MLITLTIESVPDGIADALRFRATRNNLSLQDELLAILRDLALV